MANEPVISKDGIYYDMASGKIVKKPPVEGIQYVGPGGVIDDEAARQIAALEALEAEVPKAK